jgi:hypothetical protein
MLQYSSPYEQDKPAQGESATQGPEVARGASSEGPARQALRQTRISVPIRCRSR